MRFSQTTYFEINPMKQAILFVFLTTFYMPAMSVSAQEPGRKPSPDVETQRDSKPDDKSRDAIHRKWDAQIRELEAMDTQTASTADSILLLGSSSIRLWETAQEQLAPYHVIRRGYGGARFSDLVVFADRLVSPHTFQAVVIFVANDISGKRSKLSPEKIAEDPVEANRLRDATPEDVEPNVRRIIETIHEHQPEAAVLLVEVTPTPKREHVWSNTRSLNAMLRELALTTPNTYFVETAEHYLDAAKRPRGEFFRDDQLHQNAAGYELWASLIRRRLNEVTQTAR